MKIWLIAATLLIVLGIFLFAFTMAANQWDFSKLSTKKYETNLHTVSEAFHHISINTNTADIVFLPSEDDTCKVICYEEEHLRHSVSVQNETLLVQVVDTRKFLDHIGISWESTKITVYLPQKEYGALQIADHTGDIEIPKDFRFQSMDILTSTGDIKNYASASEDIKFKTSTGDIHTENISAKAMRFSSSAGSVDIISAICEEILEINVTTGKIKIADISCKNLISKGSTGDFVLLNLIAEERISIQRNTGDVKFYECDAGELFVKTSTGDVTGSLLSEKSFVTDSNTGKISIPKNTVGGKCEIFTDTGDIKINIK